VRIAEGFKKIGRRAATGEEKRMLKMKATNEEVYVADQPVVNVGRSDVEFLRERVHGNARKRVRLCAHKETDDKLHEMFVVYVKETYIKPNKHLGKDESLHILEGLADLVFFDDEGNVTDVVSLGEYSSGRQFYCRIPESVYHTLLIRSDMIAIHESTPGPFNRADTIFAPWAPEEGDIAAVRRFTERLEESARYAVPGAR
jgi:cupin fold WbuC family metalloprotein